MFFFPLILGVSSSQLTNTYIFQRGRAQPPTSISCFEHLSFFFFSVQHDQITWLMSESIHGYLHMFFCWDVDPQSLHGARCGWIESNGNDVGARIGSGFEDVPSKCFTCFSPCFLERWFDNKKLAKCGLLKQGWENR